MFSHNRSRALIAALLFVAAPATAQDDRRQVPMYAPTLTFGTGLVSIPVAWISQGNGDIFASMSTRFIGPGPSANSPNTSSLDATQTLDAHLGKRLSIGVSLYGTKLQQLGFHSQFLVVEQPQNGPKWLPSIALGVRNIGSSRYQDRFVTGQRRATDVYGDAGPPAGTGFINGAPSIYGVATREVLFGQRSDFSFSIGYGTGLFRKSGNMGLDYNTSGTLVDGLFLGSRVVVPAGEKGSLSMMVDNNGFDWSVGASFTYGFISVGAYLSEIEEGARDHATEKPGQLANYMKPALSLSYNSSIPGIFTGSRQRVEVADAQLELKRLTQEIAQRRATTAELNTQLAKARAAADAATRGQQAALEKQLEAERIALKAAADRLEALQKKPPEKK
jgi:hypothetical protein